MTDDIQTLIAATASGDEARLAGLEDGVWIRVDQRRAQMRMGQVRLAAVAMALVIGGGNGGLMLAASRSAPSEMQVFAVSADASPLTRLDARG